MILWVTGNWGFILIMSLDMWGKVWKCEKYYVLLPAERTSVILPAFVKASQSEGTHKSSSKYVKGYETDKMDEYK